MYNKFSELGEPDKLLENLLLGNGFSIWFSDRFLYRSLLDQCDNLLSEDKELFGRLETSNFETTLNALNNAIIVNSLYGVSHNHKDSYERIKISLIEAVRKVHLERYEVNQTKLEIAKSLFNKSEYIFTTNYDLLSYWTMLLSNAEKKSQGEKYGDAFNYDYKENQRISNDLYFAEKFSKNTGKMIYYLHGGLHLYVNGRIKKLYSRSTDRLLNTLEENIDKGLPPLFVSEGDWALKKKTIEANTYLNFCYERLKHTAGNLTVFGHSLDEKTDLHMIQAINYSKVKKVIYGVYCPGKTESQLRLEEARIKHNLEEKEVIFYDASSLFDFTYDVGFGSLGF